MAGSAVCLRVGAAGGVAESADWSTRNRWRTDTVASGALGSKITGCWDYGVVV